MKQEEDKIEKEIKELFDFFDKDGSLSIDGDELKDRLKCFGENVIDEEVNDMISAMDKDGNGSIEYEEFSREMRIRYGKRNVEKELTKLFDRFKREETNIITRSEIRSIMKNFFKEEITNQEADDMIKIAGSGKIYLTIDDFKKIMLDQV